MLAYGEFQEQQTEEKNNIHQDVPWQLCKISGRNLHQWLLKTFIISERAQISLVYSLVP